MSAIPTMPSLTSGEFSSGLTEPTHGRPGSRCMVIWDRWLSMSLGPFGPSVDCRTCLSPVANPEIGEDRSSHSCGASSGG